MIMTRRQYRVATLVGVLIAGVYALAGAQGQESVAARHVRSAPIRVGRLVSAPILDAVGSFTPLPDSVNIIGLVQNEMGVLVPNAGTVVIRELQNGTVAGRAVVNHLARFGVGGLPTGLYSAELISPSGAVLATTPAFSASRGEIVQIAHTVPVSRRRGFAAGLASATSAALTVAASSGVLAIIPGAPVTPGS
jgi:hypothetical protein